MKRRLLKILAVFIGILIILAIGLTLSIDYIAKSGIERTGTEMFQAPLSVSSVTISLFSGNGRIEGLSVSNPDGFEEGEAMVIQSIQIKMDPLTLLSDTIIVHEIDVQTLDVSFLLQPAESNLGQLHRNLEDYSATREPMDVAMIVDRFIMENASLTVRTGTEATEPYTVTLPRVEHTGIGRGEEADLSAVLIVIFDEILNQVTGEGLEQLLEEGEMRIRDEAEDVLRELLDSEQ